MFPQTCTLGKFGGVEDAVLSPVWMITGRDGSAFVRPAHSGMCVSLCASKNVHTNGVCSTKVKEDVLGREKPAHSEREVWLLAARPDILSPQFTCGFQIKSLHSSVPPVARHNDRIPHLCLALSTAVFDSLLVAPTVSEHTAAGENALLPVDLDACCDSLAL